MQRRPAIAETSVALSRSPHDCFLRRPFTLGRTPGRRLFAEPQTSYNGGDGTERFHLTGPSTLPPGTLRAHYHPCLPLGRPYPQPPPPCAPERDVRWLQSHLSGFGFGRGAARARSRSRPSHGDRKYSVNCFQGGRPHTMGKRKWILLMKRIVDEGIVAAPVGGQWTFPPHFRRGITPHQHKQQAVPTGPYCSTGASQHRQVLVFVCILGSCVPTSLNRPRQRPQTTYEHLAKARHIHRIRAEPSAYDRSAIISAVMSRTPSLAPIKESRFPP